ncbi:MAG: hypothetical protein H6746_19835 [Deltaproteobacteria bacterium]|nr:hypothetical protein [Deltaproteobacteria bacterium]
MRALAPCAAALLVALVGGVARPVTVATHGELRQRYVVLSPFEVDAAGTPHGNRSRDELRLDVGGRFEISRQLWMRTMLQVLDGQILGDESPLEAGPGSRAWHNAGVRDDLFLREAVVQVPIGLGDVRVGRRAAYWGLGLAVHDGRTASTPFADARGGDIYNGILVDAVPMRAFAKGRAAEAVHLRLAFDVVERDELVDRTRGDLALRYSGSVMWEEPFVRAGVMLVHRSIDVDGGAQRSDTLFDVLFSLSRPLGRTLDLVVSAEAAALAGSVEEQAADGPTIRTTLRQFGALARVALKAPATGLEAALELGAASGDSDPLDGTDTAFRFDPAYRVGMILFEEVLARTTAAERRDLLAADDSIPRSRVDAYATQGAVSNALYLAPVVSFEACSGCFIGNLGALVAFSPTGVASPSAALREVKNTNPYGGKAASALLGWELNAGAALRVALPHTAAFSVGAQYGFFSSGPALDDVRGEPGPGLVHKWRVQATITW